MKRLLGMIVMTALFTTAASSETFKEATQRKTELKACIGAVSDFEKMAGTTSSYSYTDRTGRQINVNFGTLCTALPAFNKYIEGEFSNQDHVARMKAVANLLLLRSPISDKELGKRGVNFLNKNKGFNVSDERKIGLYLSNFLHSDFLAAVKDEDMNVLTPKKGRSVSAIAAYLTRCYTGLYCHTDKHYGLGNKYFQSLLLALTQRDYNQALDVLVDYNKYINNNSEIDVHIANYIHGTMNNYKEKGE